jgi:adenine-specific DNA methylase
MISGRAGHAPLQPVHPISEPELARIVLPAAKGPRAIEDQAFPFEIFSQIAELESWRKEINRPLSHIHKWWAQRLGTVFRSIIIGALAPKGADLEALFYSKVQSPNAIIFDPFMGSGTTLVETLKIGARAIGRDINPVVYFLVRNALAVHDRTKIAATFKGIERDVAKTLRSLYQTRLPNGSIASVLYYFWVKTLPCPSCKTEVDLFSTRIFARHAYPKKYPEAQATCPRCGHVNTVRYDARNATCQSCAEIFDPAHGPASGQKACCPSCKHEFPIARTVKAEDTPPRHRLYAKLVLLPDGRKQYLAAGEYDRDLYAKAEKKLAKRADAFPVIAIEPGYNTNQALNYNYKHWHQFFNARQLLSLSILANRIRDIEDPVLRNLFTCLFSGTLEFNNMFASYKGEGTGAVRHMFYHHIIKPERTPLEANLWGTPKSSGSFSTMFETRIMRALDYADNPCELRCIRSQNGKNVGDKVFGLSEALGCEHAARFQSFDKARRVYLSCGDSSRMDIPAKTIDLIVTDPPFLDNVHYSQLADFFYVWQRHILGAEGPMTAPTTRSGDEVQHAETDAFAHRLSGVWAECNRILKDDGLLIFSYHHSRNEGWHCVLEALAAADFGIVAAHPIKAEMSVATPKSQAKEPIDLDIILVCRKLSTLKRRKWNGDLWVTATDAARAQIVRFSATGRRLSRNDVRVIVMAQLLRCLSTSTAISSALILLDEGAQRIEDAISCLHAAQ